MWDLNELIGLVSFTFKIIQNIFSFVKVRNVPIDPTVIYLQEKQIPAAGI